MQDIGKRIQATQKPFWLRGRQEMRTIAGLITMCAKPYTRIQQQAVPVATMTNIRSIEVFFSVTLVQVRYIDSGPAAGWHVKGALRSRGVKTPKDPKILATEKIYQLPLLKQPHYLPLVVCVGREMQ